MINQMTINSVNAVITYDPDIDLFRGEFIAVRLKFGCNVSRLFIIYVFKQKSFLT